MKIRISSLSKETQTAIIAELARIPLKEELSAETEDTLDVLSKKIKALLEAVLPAEALIQVTPYKSLGEKYLAILIAASSQLINHVQGQYPQLVSLSLNTELELQTQVFRGNGGNVIYRSVDRNNPAESWLTVKSIKIPFRKPKATEEAVLSAIEDFAKEWLEALKDNQALLKYNDLVDYEQLLSTLVQADAKKTISQEVLDAVEKNTEENHTSENLILITKELGDTRLILAAEAVLALHKFYGSLTHDLSEVRKDLYKTAKGLLYVKFANASELWERL